MSRSTGSGRDEEVDQRLDRIGDLLDLLGDRLQDVPDILPEADLDVVEARALDAVHHVGGTGRVDPVEQEASVHVGEGRVGSHAVLVGDAQREIESKMRFGGSGRGDLERSQTREAEDSGGVRRRVVEVEVDPE